MELYGILVCVLFSELVMNLEQDTAFLRDLLRLHIRASVMVAFLE